MNHVVVESSDGDDDTKPLLEGNEEHGTSFLRLIIYGSIIVSPSLLAGIALSFSAIALPQMNLNISDASWFSAMFNLGSPLGSILIGPIIDKFGRRPCIIISIIPSVVGWFLLCLDFQRLITFTGRILTGVNAGCMYVGQVYAAECIVVNHPHWRNPLNTWQAVALSFGTVLTYAFGCLLPYQGVALITTGLSALLLLVNYLYVPESPKWLYHKGRINEARRSEKMLGIHQPILKHIDSIEECFLIDKMSIMKKLRRKDVYKPLLVMMVLYVLVMFSGGSAVAAYMVDIISIDSQTSQSPVSTVERYIWREYIGEPTMQELTSDNTSNGYQLGLIASVLVLIAVCLVSSVIRYTGIKKLYCLASIGMAVGLVFLGVSLLHFENRSIQNLVNVLHVASVWCVAFFYSFGVITIPTSILGELFPHDAKGFASIPAIFFCLSAASALKFHPYLFLYFGATLYFFYALVALLSTVFFALFIPETVGKTLEEIGEFFWM